MAIPKIVRTALQNRRVAVVILDSGKATRQGILCDHRRNPLALTKGGLPAGNLILTDFQVWTARLLGFEEVHLTVPPHPGVNFLSTYYRDSELHGINVKIHEEDKIRGTLGAIKRLFTINKINPATIDTLVVLFGDTVHNIDLVPILQAHLESNSALTVPVTEVFWRAEEWFNRTFGTFGLEGMPRRPDYDSFAPFKLAYKKFMDGKQKALLPVTEFSEQMQDPERYITTSGSNLRSAGMAIFNIELWKRLSENLPEEYHDIGHHLYPSLGGRVSEFSGVLSPDFVRGIEQNKYPFYAYIVPDKNDEGNEIYCRDIANPQALLRLNHDIARGLIHTRIDDPDCRFWRKMHPYGFVGTSFTQPESWGVKILGPENESVIGPILGSHTDFTRTEIDPLTVVRDYSIIKAKEIYGSLIFGGSEHNRVYISEGWRIKNCIIFGPVKLERSNEHVEFVGSPELRNLIIYPNPDDPAQPSFMSIYKVGAPPMNGFGNGRR